MNIFVLDYDVTLCAQYHMDKHVVKMPTESAQMLCAAKLLCGEEAPYKLTHKGHPCTKWVLESRSNWNWLKSLACELNKEWQFRYGHIRDHLAWAKIKDLTAPRIPDVGLTTFAQAMPDQYRSEDTVKAYRGMYIGHKEHLAEWTKRGAPKWFLLKEPL